MLMLNNVNVKLSNVFFSEHPMKDIVLTVPVYYNQAERKALLE